MGFLHCIDETPPPSVSPSSSGVPTSKPSTSVSPTDECLLVEVNIFSDGYSDSTWTLYKVAYMNGTYYEEAEIVETFDENFEPESLKVHTIRLCEGIYEFSIRDSIGIFPGYYTFTSSGQEIEQEIKLGDSETTVFSIPASAQPYTQSTSSTPTVPLPPEVMFVDGGDVDVDVEDTATQEELIATFNDITDQTVVESDDTVEILPQTISEVNPDEPFD